MIYSFRNSFFYGRVIACGMRNIYNRNKEMTKHYMEPQAVVICLEAVQTFAQSEASDIRPWESMGEYNDDLSF